MKRVVVTGMGIWSCIGQDLQTVTGSLRKGQSGIIFDPQRIKDGLHCGLIGDVPRPNLRPLLERRFRVNMQELSEFAYMAAREAFETANISADYRKQNSIGVIFGNGGSSYGLEETWEIMRTERDSMLVGPASIFRTEASHVSMNLATIFGLRGINLSVAAACASSNHAIGVGTMFIRSGMQEMVLVGGAMETSPMNAVGEDAIEALSLRNDIPQQACRPFDKKRDGLIPSGGAAALILEEYEHAMARGAAIYGEIAGYGFSSNGTDTIAAPNSESEYRAMANALKDAQMTPEQIDLVNPHAASTQVGDREEAFAIKKLFGEYRPWVTSTKSMTGHEGWAAGACETVYSLLMMNNNFVAPTINLENVDECAKGLKIAHKAEPAIINSILNHSTGLGGTNSALIIKKI